MENNIDINVKGLKVFISQPMTGHTKEEILKDREVIKEFLKKKYSTDYMDFVKYIIRNNVRIPKAIDFNLNDIDFEIIDNLQFDNEENQLKILANDLKLLAQADLMIVHPDGTSRGCMAEIGTAEIAKIPIYYMSRNEFDMGESSIECKIAFSHDPKSIRIYVLYNGNNPVPSFSYIENTIRSIVLKPEVAPVIGNLPKKLNNLYNMLKTNDPDNFEIIFLNSTDSCKNMSTDANWMRYCSLSELTEIFAENISIISGADIIIDATKDDKSDQSYKRLERSIVYKYFDPDRIYQFSAFERLSDDVHKELIKNK